jgi:Rod binding domain-containing protein
MDIGISSSADLSGAELAASSWTLPHAHNSALIPDNENFHQALQTASDKAASDKTDTPEKISAVAKQFEAVMIGQILKTARESSGGGWLDSEDDQEDQTGSMVMEMAEQGFSQAIAARGGLGIAKMVTANIERGESKSAKGQTTTASSDSQAPTQPSPHTDWKR